MNDSFKRVYNRYAVYYIAQLEIFSKIRENRLFHGQFHGMEKSCQNPLDFKKYQAFALWKWKLDHKVKDKLQSTRRPLIKKSFYHKILDRYIFDGNNKLT